MPMTYEKNHVIKFAGCLFAVPMLAHAQTFDRYVAVAVLRMCSRTRPLAMLIMRKSIYQYPLGLSPVPIYTLRRREAP